MNILVKLLPLIDNAVLVMLGMPPLFALGPLAGANDGGGG